MNATQLIGFLMIALQNGWAMLIQSSPGLGKSDIVSQCAARLGFDLLILHPVTDDPTDAKGLPVFANGIADFIPYGNLLRMINATRPLIVFLDDLGQAAQSVQAAYMQLILCRQINGKAISPHVRFVAATNRRSDNAGVAGLITPLISRFHAVLELAINVADWAQWAIKAGLPLELIAFVNFRPALLSTFDAKAAKEGKPFACPRTVAMLGDWIKAGVDDPKLFAGCVGESFATEFAAFLQIYRQVGNLPAQVCINPQTAPIPASLDQKFALCAALSYHVTKQNADSIGIYCERIESEFATFFWKTATARKPEIVDTNAFTRWAIVNSTDIK
jgi:hypothetical protein